jgi:transcription initiation factor TFIID subunit 7
MEKQFILRLHESIRHIVDLREATLDITSGKSVVLRHRSKEYPGIVVRLPCIVESQKTMDGKQYYKVADISTLVVVYPHSDFDFDRERELLETSGLTAPMKFVKCRRFRKKPSLTEYVEGIEKKISELLARDMQARTVEIVTKGEKEISDELDILAAEIENRLVESAEEKREPPPEAVPVAGRFSEEIEELEKSVEEKRKQMESALNPILQKRFQGQLEGLERQLTDLRKRQSEDI